MTIVTDAPKPVEPVDIAPWSPQSLFSERHNDATGPDLEQVPGDELPVSLFTQDTECADYGQAPEYANRHENRQARMAAPRHGECQAAGPTSATSLEK